MSLLGHRLRELRENRSLFQVERGTGISRIEISRYEKGQYSPSPKNLRKLSVFFDVTYGELRVLQFEEMFHDPEDRLILIEWVKTLISNN